MPSLSPPVYDQTISLHSFPPELVLHILQSLSSPLDLHALISASPTCLALFTRSPCPILFRVLTNALHPVAMVEAVAILYARKALHPPGSTVSVVDKDAALCDFLLRYFGSEGFEFVRDKASLVALSRLYLKVDRFAHDFAARSLKILKDLDPVGPGFAVRSAQQWRVEVGATAMSRRVSDLSISEMARLHRAFLRHELYCQMFRTDLDDTGRQLFQRDSQFEWFLAKLDSWENEEISCVHQYFMSVFVGLIDDIEHQLVRAVRQAHITMHPLKLELLRDEDDTGEPILDRVASPPHSERNGGWNAYDSLYHASHMFDFTTLDWTDLQFCTTNSNAFLFKYVSYLSSLGLNFINRLIFADPTERKNTIRSRIPQQRDFLPEALGYGLSFSTSPSLNKPPTPHLGCNLGWHLFHHSDDRDYRYTGSFHINTAVRAGGYVFWDVWRIMEVKTQLLAVRAMYPYHASALFGRRSRFRSAQAQLRGFAVPKVVWDLIIKEFGSTHTGELYIPNEDE